MAIEDDASVKLSRRTKIFVPTRLYASTTGLISLIKLAPQLSRPILPVEAHARAGNAQGRVFKPYRLIYRVHSKQVIVYVVTDGRRDMASLLARRLLGA